MKKKIFSILIIISMFVGMLPVSAAVTNGQLEALQVFCDKADAGHIKLVSSGKTAKLSSDGSVLSHLTNDLEASPNIIPKTAYAIVDLGLSYPIAAIGWLGYANKWWNYLPIKIYGSNDNTKSPGDDGVDMLISISGTESQLNSLCSTLGAKVGATIDSSKYRYIYYECVGTTDMHLSEIYVWAEMADVFGEWVVDDATSNVTFTVPVYYNDPEIQQSFTMRLTKYNSLGAMTSEPVDTVIDSAQTSSQDLSASIEVGLTDSVQAMLFDEDGKLVSQYSYGFDGFGANNGTASSFDDSAISYTIDETSATISGKSVQKDDIITIEVIKSDAADGETAFDNKTFADMFYIAQTASDSGYKMVIPFDGADSGDYYIRITRTTSQGESECLYKKFKMIDPVLRQNYINAFFVPDADYGECIDNIIAEDILSADSLVDRDVFYDDDFSAVAAVVSEFMADDDVNAVELLNILNTATVVYKLSNGDVTVMQNDEYAAYVLDNDLISNYVQEELGYILDITITPSDNIDAITNIGESGIFSFGFDVPQMDKESFAGAIHITKGDSVVDIMPYSANDNCVTYYAGDFESNTQYTITFKAGEDGCLTADGKKMLQDISFDFATGEIIDAEYIEGKIIKNVVLNKPILNSVITQNGVDASKILDGQRSSVYSKIQGGERPVIDIGSYVIPAYMRIDYFGGTSNWWNAAGITYRAGAYPLLDENGIPRNDGFEGENGYSFYVSEMANIKPASALDSGKYVSLAEKGYGDVIADFGPVRYIQLQANNSIYLYEFSLYAYVDSEVGALSVSNDEFSADEDYTFEVPVTENTGAKTYGMIINAYDANGNTIKTVAENVSVTNGKIQATITDLPAESVGITAMVVENFANMNQLCTSLTVGEAIAESETTPSDSVSIQADTEKIVVNVGLDDNVTKNSQYAVTVISADGFSGEMSDVFASITDEQIEESLVYSASGRVCDGVVFDIDSLADGKYYVQVVVNSLDGTKVVKKQYRQAIISQEATEGIINNIMSLNGADLKNAVYNAIYTSEAISLDVIAQSAEFASMLEDERFVSILGYTRDMLYVEDAQIADVINIINAATTVFALDSGNKTNAKSLLATYGSILGDCYINSTKAEKLTDVFVQFRNKITDADTLFEVIEWSCLLSLVYGELDDTVAMSFEDYSQRYGIDIEYATSKKVSLKRVANYFDRDNLAEIYGKTAFNKEYEAAVKSAVAEKNANASSDKGVSGTNGSLSGGMSGGGGSGGSGDNKETTKPTPAPVIKETKSGFSDMSGYEWADSAVASLREKAIVSGTQNGNFEPSRNVTRAEFVKMLMVATNIKVDESAYMKFFDVPEDSWYFPYIKLAYSRNICRGIDDFYFNPHGNITRQDMAVMINNYLSAESVSIDGNKVEFADKALFADYATDAVQKVSGAGLMNGYEDGSFRPTENTKRAEAAVVISRLIDMID